MKASISKQATLNLTLEVPGQDVSDELHKLIAARYKDSYVIKAILSQSPPVFGKDFGISLKIKIVIEPTMDILADNPLSGSINDETPF